ncbi:class I SAM-dependent methyltransferase [Pendulispora brunnea]|uniref:Class I SAM-dependent methyltransferase n=1 Tax=Pendulispora brunnea TaxID=2905690 RepID=A0ABZ2KEA5_9BACT
MNNTSLYSPRVTSTVERLLRTAETVDAEITPRAFAHIKATGGVRDDQAVAHLLRDAYMAIDVPTAKFLYNLVRARGAATVVEFGTSFGFSTIHLAAAVKDLGAGRVISTEQEPAKVIAARANLEEAGVADVVEILEGDALGTLENLEESIDVLFLDGWKALYLPVLKLVEPRLAPDAVVVADDLAIMPEKLAPYLEYVRNPKNGYSSVEIPLGDRLEFSVRAHA